MNNAISFLLLSSAVSALNCTTGASPTSSASPTGSGYPTNGTNGTVFSQDFDQWFVVYDRNKCLQGCPEDLTHPVDGLRWTNVQLAKRVTPLDFIRPGGQLPPWADPSNPSNGAVLGPDGIWTGEAINATQPAIATSQYNGSCVKYWQLDAIALGCNLFTPDVGSGPADCNITVAGFDGTGQRVGQEKFFYHGEVVTTGFPPYWLETTYNTTAGGLKGKKLRRISILADVPHDPTTTTPELGIGEVWYTVFNSTKCS